MSIRIWRSGEVDGLAEELHARERAVHDVEVHRRREEEDEERREREVGDQRPAGGRLAEDFLDARDEGSHDGISGFSGAATRAVAHEIHEDVLEARAQRRQLLELSSRRAQAVDERIDVVEIAGGEVEVAVDALDRGSRLAKGGEERVVDAGGHELVARARGGQVLDAAGRGDAPAAQHGDAVAGALDLGEQVRVEQHRSFPASPLPEGGRGSPCGPRDRRRPSARRAEGLRGRGSWPPPGPAAASCPSKTSSRARRPIPKAARARGAPGRACGPGPQSMPDMRPKIVSVWRAVR